ncbi:hypothetical protein [Nonomuraea sp. NPDC003201]
MAFLSQIPRGHQDPPRLVVCEDKVLDFDIDDVDGRLFMLDRELGGSVTASFSKRIDLTAHGRDHTLHVEGFTDTDGITMEPVDLVIRTRPRMAPQRQFAEHEEIARRVAEEGIVLLENRDDVLPLAPGTLNVFGHARHAFRTSVVGADR